jgi:hypothetical protein
MPELHANRAARYVIGGRPFRSKQEVKQYVRGFISASEVGQTVTDAAIQGLLRIHPDWEKKSTGMNRLCIDEIHVAHLNTSHKSILIERHDGLMDISWNWCIDLLTKEGVARKYSNRSDHLAKVKNAARATIQDQINQIPKQPGEEIDHIYPRTFNRILFLFLKWWSVPIMNIGVLCSEGSECAYSFEDWEIESNWWEWHQRLARLRAIPAHENRRAPVYPVDWSRLP